MKIDEMNATDLMWFAVEEKDEKNMKEIIMVTLEIFLKNNDFTKDNVEDVASIYLTAPIELKWEKDFQFKDRKLKYVLEELSQFSTISNKRTRENAKRFILYLKGKNYDDK